MLILSELEVFVGIMEMLVFSIKGCPVKTSLSMSYNHAKLFDSAEHIRGGRDINLVCQLKQKDNSVAR
jgi:hypothetical protein